MSFQIFLPSIKARNDQDFKFFEANISSTLKRRSLDIRRAIFDYMADKYECTWQLISMSLANLYTNSESDFYLYWRTYIFVKLSCATAICTLSRRFQNSSNGCRMF